MKAFNLQEAKNGRPVQTKGGRDVRIICWDRKGFDFPIIGLFMDQENGIEKFIFFDEKGRVNSEHAENDLVMKPEIKERWINLYWDETLQTYCPGAVAFNSEDKAKEGISPYKNHVVTVKVAWED